MPGAGGHETASGLVGVGAAEGLGLVLQYRLGVWVGEEAASRHRTGRTAVNCAATGMPLLRFGMVGGWHTRLP